MIAERRLASEAERENAAPVGRGRKGQIFGREKQILGHARGD
jgi:hypothetical protein